MMTNKTALILGATGVVGTQLVKEISNSNIYNEIHLLTRREMKFRERKCTGHVVDFDNLSQYAYLFNVTDVFICLGTTIKKAKSKEAFRKVDYDYIIEAAKMAKTSNVEKLLVITAMGANSKSKFFYSRVKGDVEGTLQHLEMNTVHIFRPSLLLGEREEFRAGEKISGVLSTFLKFVFVGPLRPYRAIEANKVAAAMYAAAQTTAKGYHFYNSEEIEKLAQRVTIN
ncbi:NAD-dependent epimerase/dehydratase family protein [Peribacillus simplex]|uniref:NAD-dependent epimerase/dehydratase family protein n=2 Tax=Peribacillus simplex TaxID=1478 RepID=A0A9X8ZLJ6_9BACI|nr:NAD-dependent epimerase/dehydratase family protein [Peribacillus simplex]TKH15539.1 NAD-dependent epimerase/dehydratase family protein [Peribacillus simplex]